MDEYASLAQRVVLTMDDVRGCLVLSRDGLVLGAFPEDEEAAVKPAWLKFVHVGDARRSFVEFADQTWAFIHRGPYSAFVVAGTAARPGVLLDQLEQALLVAEETRARRDTLKVPDAAAAPSGRPRTSLHPPAERPQPVEVAATPAVAEAAVEPVATGPWKRPVPGSAPVQAGGEDGTAPQALQPPPAGLRPLQPIPDGPAVGSAEPVAPTSGTPPPGGTPFKIPGRDLPDLGGGEPDDFADSPFAEFQDVETDEVPSTGDDGSPMPSDDPLEALEAAVVEAPAPEAEENGEIDRVMLAKEFSGLLQLDADDDEGSS